MKISGIRWYNLQDLLLCIKKCILTSFVALGMRLEGNTPKKRRPTFSILFSTMLLHTSRFMSRFSSQRMMWQHWSIPYTLLTWFELIFTFSLNWNQHWRDGTFVMLLTSLVMRRISWTGFHKTGSRNVSNSFIVADRRVKMWKGNILKEMYLQWLYFSVFTHK